MSGEVITWEMEASGHGGQLSQRRTEDKKKNSSAGVGFSCFFRTTMECRIK